jgi:endonuclease YncB( thermonuclease family)
MSVDMAGEFMTTTRTLLAGLAMAFASAAPAGERCSAIDGATLGCGRERIRVEGLRAPALEAPGGHEARARLQRRIQSGELVIDRTGRDKWGHTLGRAYVNGKRVTQLDVDANPKRGRSNRS